MSNLQWSCEGGAGSISEVSEQVYLRTKVPPGMAKTLKFLSTLWQPYLLLPFLTATHPSAREGRHKIRIIQKMSKTKGQMFVLLTIKILTGEPLCPSLVLKFVDILDFHLLWGRRCTRCWTGPKQQRNDRSLCQYQSKKTNIATSTTYSVWFGSYLFVSNLNKIFKTHMLDFPTPIKLV